jgi:tryptophan halogenase
LFIDCTGWKSLLKDSDRNYLNGRLFCNTPLCSRIPYTNRKEELTPYTITESVHHGWIWKTPVRTRIGSGLVFNRDITTIEEAKEYFVNYWNNRISKEDLKVLELDPILF